MYAGTTSKQAQQRGVTAATHTPLGVGGQADRQTDWAIGAQDKRIFSERTLFSFPFLLLAAAAADAAAATAVVAPPTSRPSQFSTLLHFSFLPSSTHSPSLPPPTNPPLTHPRTHPRTVFQYRHVDLDPEHAASVWERPAAAGMSSSRSNTTGAAVLQPSSHPNPHLVHLLEQLQLQEQERQQHQRQYQLPLGLQPPQSQTLKSSLSPLPSAAPSVGAGAGGGGVGGMLPLLSPQPGKQIIPTASLPHQTDASHYMSALQKHQLINDWNAQKLSPSIGTKSPYTGTDSHQPQQATVALHARKSSATTASAAFRKAAATLPTDCVGQPSRRATVVPLERAERHVGPSHNEHPQQQDIRNQKPFAQSQYQLRPQQLSPMPRPELQPSFPFQNNEQQQQMLSLPPPAPPPQRQLPLTPQQEREQEMVQLQLQQQYRHPLGSQSRSGSSSSLASRGGGSPFDQQRGNSLSQIDAGYWGSSSQNAHVPALPTLSTHPYIFHSPTDPIPSLIAGRPIVKVTVLLGARGHRAPSLLAQLISQQPPLEHPHLKLLASTGNRYAGVGEYWDASSAHVIIEGNVPLRRSVKRLNSASMRSGKVRDHVVKNNDISMPMMGWMTSTCEDLCSSTEEMRVDFEGEGGLVGILATCHSWVYHGSDAFTLNPCCSSPSGKSSLRSPPASRTCPSTWSTPITDFVTPPATETTPAAMMTLLTYETRHGGPKVVHWIVLRSWGCGSGTLKDGDTLDGGWIAAECTTRGSPVHLKGAVGPTVRGASTGGLIVPPLRIALRGAHAAATAAAGGGVGSGGSGAMGVILGAGEYHVLAGVEPGYKVVTQMESLQKVVSAGRLPRGAGRVRARRRRSAHSWPPRRWVSRMGDRLERQETVVRRCSVGDDEEKGSVGGGVGGARSAFLVHSVGVQEEVTAAVNSGARVFWLLLPALKGSTLSPSSSSSSSSSSSVSGGSPTPGDAPQLFSSSSSSSSSSRSAAAAAAAVERIRLVLVCTSDRGYARTVGTATYVGTPPARKPDGTGVFIS
ncbi:hypothetical protein DFJ73DRAFT_767408 [Zopfochytrium polystomum]|nr:hypothetical protein DFJ73DRAFT_767408 [Zopfochytrium polystomum]